MKKREYHKLKNHFENMSHEELINELFVWIDSDKAIQEHYLRVLYPSQKSPIHEYKKKIQRNFFGSFPPSDNYLGASRLLVKEHERSRPPPDELADLQLYLVEKGVAFTKRYGDIDEDFYCMLEESYEEACQTITKFELEDIFCERYAQILRDTDMMGWGFHDELIRITELYFSDFD